MSDGDLLLEASLADIVIMNSVDNLRQGNQTSTETYPDNRIFYHWGRTLEEFQAAWPHEEIPWKIILL